MTAMDRLHQPIDDVNRHTTAPPTNPCTKTLDNWFQAPTDNSDTLAT